MSALQRFAWPLAVLLAWLLAWSHLAGEWAADEQYRFGFGVPVLAAWMAWRRFSHSGPIKPARPNAFWWCAVGTSLALLALGEALALHDPQWRFTGATLAGGATLLFLAWSHRRGGWSLVRRQIFPAFFAATAVPWPVPVEIWTIHHLAGAVTDVATLAINLLGIAALQHGNTIELAHSTVGVDDACSGIQSLQAVLMASLFAGEVFTLTNVRRIALVVAGAAISFVTNCARVLALTLLAHRGGTAHAMEWHDAVGGTATVVAFALVFGAALLAARDQTAPLVPSVRHTSLRAPEGVTIFALVFAVPIMARVWFSHLENADPFSESTTAWTLAADHLPPGWTAKWIAPTKTLRTGLRFDEWQSYTLRNAEGATAEIIRLAWHARTRLPGFVTNHTPAVCLPAAGWTQPAPPFLLTLKIRGADLPCAAYPFERDGARLLAVQSLRAAGRSEIRLVDPAQIPGTLRRLATLWEAPQRQISDELLLYFPDPGDDAARRKSATAFLEAVLADPHGH